MIIKCQVGIQRDTVFPRDELIITPHFEVAQGIIFGGVEADDLADDLANAVSSWHATGAQTRVKVYNAQAPRPSFPLAEKIVNAPNAPASSVPRELAMCLSYYAERNQPRTRGRLYIPLAAWMTGPGSLDGRPSAGVRSRVEELVPIFAALGGANVDWVVYSRADDDARKVTNYWIDDEWDTVRSRGLRPTTRTSGTTSG